MREITWIEEMWPTGTRVKARFKREWHPGVIAGSNDCYVFVSFDDPEVGREVMFRADDGDIEEESSSSVNP